MRFNARAAGLLGAAGDLPGVPVFSKVRRSAPAGGGGGTDPNFANVVLLALNDNQPNGTTTFADQSSSAKTITPSGSAAYSSTKAPTGMTTSCRFAGGQSLAIASSADFGFGTGDFSIEWMQYYDGAGLYTPFDQRTTDPQVAPLLYANAGSEILRVNGVDRITAAGATSAGWQFNQLIRASGTTKFYRDGVQVGSSYADTNSYIASPFRLGANFVPGNFLAGYIACMRVTTGVARTPSATPTLPFPTS